MEAFNNMIEELQIESAKTTQVSKTRCRKLLSKISKQCKHARAELLAERKKLKAGKASKASKAKKVKPLEVIVPRNKPKKKGTR